MATRSFIARYDSTTHEYTAIYCHWDGYPEGVGATLRDHYDDDEKVRLLVNCGGLSSLGDTLGTSVPLLSGDEPSIIFESAGQMKGHYRNMWCEYGYIWEDGMWKCYDLTPRYINLYSMEMENTNV